jgi:hypothetical protein
MSENTAHFESRLVHQIAEYRLLVEEILLSKLY